MKKGLKSKRILFWGQVYPVFGSTHPYCYDLSPLYPIKWLHKSHHLWLLKDFCPCTRDVFPYGSNHGHPAHPAWVNAWRCSSCTRRSSACCISRDLRNSASWESVSHLGDTPSIWDSIPITWKVYPWEIRYKCGDMWNICGWKIYRKPSSSDMVVSEEEENQAWDNHYCITKNVWNRNGRQAAIEWAYDPKKIHKMEYHNHQQWWVCMYVSEHQPTKPAPQAPCDASLPKPVAGLGASLVAWKEWYCYFQCILRAEGNPVTHQANTKSSNFELVF